MIFGLLLPVTAIHPQKPSESLLIGPGDLLHVQVFDTPELEQHVRVTDAGYISLLVGGSVKVNSLTPDAAARTIEVALLKGNYLIHPHVAISVEEYATLKVSILGEVKSPGTYSINTPRSILDVLTMAGGLTDIAERKVLIERRGNKEKIPYFISNDANTALDTEVFVNPGDIVLIPKAGIVYVLGDVQRPGGYIMNNNDARLTVLELIARAGGTNHSAVPSAARIIHRTKTGYQDEPLPLSAMQKGKRTDVALQPEDIVYVPFSYLRNFALSGSGIAASIGSATIYKF